MKNIIIIANFLILSTLLSLFTSCKDTINQDEDIIGNKQDIVIKLKPSIVDDQSTIDKIAINNKSNLNLATMSLDTTINVDNEYQIYSTLEPSLTNLSKNINIASTGIVKALAPELTQTYTYKIFLFEKATGKLVIERTYVRGEESNEKVFTLKKGTEFVLVAYSMNNTDTDLDQHTHYVGLNRANGLIGDFSVRMPSGDESATKDLLYTTKTIITPTSGTSFDLTIPFKHMFNQISVTVDATTVGLPITSATGIVNVKNHRSANINFGETIINRIENSNIYNLMMPSFISTGLSATSNTIVNSGSHNSYLFSLSSLKIGTKTLSGQFYPNVSLLPGVKYNLKIKINNTGDQYIPGPIPTVKIGNQVWMAHNLVPNGGYGTNAVPPTPADIQVLHSTYYQWSGSPGVEMWNATIAARGPSYWGSTTAFWTRGSSGKGPTDPCPDNFRVPEFEDYRILFSNTTRSNFGDANTNSSSNFSSGTMLTSKANESVKIFFPSQGYFSQFVGTPTGSANRNVRERGISSRYLVIDYTFRESLPTIHYADIKSGNQSTFSTSTTGATLSGISETQVFRLNSHAPIKCIKYQNF